MNKNGRGVIIANSIFGFFLLAFAFLAISTAFEAKFAVDFEDYLSTKLDYSSFSLLFYSLVGVGINCLVIVSVFTISDDKKQRQIKKRERKNSFQ